MSNRKSDHKKAAVVSYLNLGIATVFSLIITPLMVSKWGASEQGLYTGIGSFANGLALMEFGFAATITRYTAKFTSLKDKEGRENFLAMGLLSYIAIAVLVIIVGCVMAFNIANLTAIDPYQVKAARTMMFVMTFNVATFLVTHVFIGALNGTKRFFVVKIVNTAGLLVRHLLSILLIMSGFWSVGVTVSTFVVTIGLLVLNILVFNAARIKIRFHGFDKKLFKEVLSFSGYNFIHVLMVTIYWKIDEMIITTMRSTVQVSIYSVAMRITDMAQQLSVMFTQFALPGLTDLEMKKAENGAFTRAIIPAGRICMIVLVFLTITLTAFGQQFILFWMREELYAPAYVILLILLYSAIIPWIMTPFTEILKAKNKLKTITFIKLGVAVINIVLTVLFVHFWGITGAAIGTAAGLVIGDIILTNIYMHKKVGINVFAYFSRVFSGMALPVLASSIAAVILRFAVPERLFFADGRLGLFLSLGVRAGILGIIFAVSIYMFGFTYAEKDRLRHMLKRQK